MPTNQPSNTATDGLPQDARDDRTAASVITDEQLDDAPGGGGLGGAAAASPLQGSARAPGGATPNSPIDLSLPGGSPDTADAPAAEADARVEAAENDSAEPHPSSR